MSDNGAGPSGLREILSGLDTLIEDQQKRVDELKTVYDAELADLRKLRNMQRAALGPANKPGPKSKLATSRMGEEELKIILAKLAETEDVLPDIPGSFTTRTLVDFGMHKSTAERAIRYLRQTEQIRLVGERVIRGTRPSRVYVINDGE